jgi:hypothetical protein
MLLRLIEDGKPEIFQQQIYDLPVIIARIDIRFPEMLLRRHATFRCTILHWTGLNFISLSFIFSFYWLSVYLLPKQHHYYREGVKMTPSRLTLVAIIR